MLLKFPKLHTILLLKQKIWNFFTFNFIKLQYANNKGFGKMVFKNHVYLVLHISLHIYSYASYTTIIILSWFSITLRQNLILAYGEHIICLNFHHEQYKRTWHTIFLLTVSFSFAWKSYPNLSKTYAYFNYSKYNGIYLEMDSFPQSPPRRETYL